MGTIAVGFGVIISDLELVSGLIIGTRVKMGVTRHDIELYFKTEKIFTFEKKIPIKLRKIFNFDHFGIMEI